MEQQQLTERQSLVQETQKPSRAESQTQPVASSSMDSGQIVTDLNKGFFKGGGDRHKSYSPEEHERILAELDQILSESGPATKHLKNRIAVLVHGRATDTVAELNDLRRSDNLKTAKEFLKDPALRNTFKLVAAHIMEIHECNLAKEQVRHELWKQGLIPYLFKSWACIPACERYTLKGLEENCSVSPSSTLSLDSLKDKIGTLDKEGLIHSYTYSESKSIFLELTKFGRDAWHWLGEEESPHDRPH